MKPVAPSYASALKALAQVRAIFGGNIEPPPYTQTRWLLSDLETAITAADTGDMTRPAQLYRIMQRDGMISGVLGTRTGGLVRLPRKWSGDPEMVARLVGRQGRRGLFDQMFPRSELSRLHADGLVPGVSLAEMVPVENPLPGGARKVMQRRDPQYLRYRWSENRWYYTSIAGPVPITPGDGRWILHTPGGVSQPWTRGLWTALGRSYIAKDHAFMHRENYSGKLANPARYAKAPLGATETQRQGFLTRLIAWGVNTVFELPPGWDVGLLESKGEGYQVFAQTIESADLEIVVILTGSRVLVDGGTGFANADVHAAIRADLIQDDADALAQTINEQGLLPWVNEEYGAEAMAVAPMVEWDTTPAVDLKSLAEAQSAAAKAIEDQNRVVKPYGLVVDLAQYETRYGLTFGEPPDDPNPAEDTEPSPPAVEDQPVEEAA